MELASPRSPYPCFVADDWGLSCAVNEAILELSRAGLVKRVSLMAALPQSDFLLPELLATGVDLSLHFNLTWKIFHGDAPVSLVRLAALSLPSEFLQQQLRLQHSYFKNREISLDCLESHQYVHCLPWVAAAIATPCKELGLVRVRRHTDWRHPFATAFSLGVFSSRGPFSPKNGFRSVDTRELCWKAQGACSSLMVIHPAASDEGDAGDSWRFKRYLEFQKIRESWLSPTSESARG